MLTRKDFPPGFRFGVATAAYQIEGSSFGGAGPCHWDSFAATPGNTAGGSDGSRACDHYHRWPGDLDLVRDGNFDSYRFSTSWARVMPDGVNINPEGLDFYDRLVDGMVARGIAPVLTLYHWDLPSALSLQGGWCHRDIAARFADYACAVMARLGDRIEMTATLNEPWCIAWLSHFLGKHAPGLRDIRATAHASHYCLLAHATALQALRADGHGNLGIVLNFETAHPASRSTADMAAAARRDAIYNRWFLEAVTGAGYPALALDGLGPHMPAGWQDDMALIAAPLDWLGVNYYTRSILRGSDELWPSFKFVPGPLPKTGIGWEIRPEGLTEFLLRAAAAAPELPLYVTENGMAGLESQKCGTVDDTTRQGFIRDHLQAALDAIKAGVDLRGFYQWSLLDNYEWALGYGPRFGLVHVDYTTQIRTPKVSYHMLREALSR
ncbi:GH1 family beta-glucosidase [Paracoccus jeotgali]|uniref:GH1 family beta-glucosidase n=1 Tax=Paracoccus jeotgali TaxID=2065379 RepID=UPI0028ADAF02|nr:GH1 family beta-glucosidase [Paracoccus jeotgali]